MICSMILKKKNEIEKQAPCFYGCSCLVRKGLRNCLSQIKVISVGGFTVYGKLTGLGKDATKIGKFFIILT